MSASERVSEGYERIGEKLLKMRKILEAQIEKKNHISNGNHENGNGKKK